MRYFIGNFIVLLFVASCCLFAQELTHYEAARAVVEVSSTKSSEEMEPIINSLANAIPEFRQHRNEITTLVSDIMNSESYRDGKIKIYMELFTKEELLRLRELYNDPVFKKFQQNRTEYSQKFIKLVSNEIMKRLAQLHELIEGTKTDDD